VAVGEDVRVFVTVGDGFGVRVAVGLGVGVDVRVAVGVGMTVAHLPAEPALKIKSSSCSVSARLKISTSSIAPLKKPLELRIG
jgi:hypothetical protein